MTSLKIIIDSNIYFRLAQSLHPLLKHKFGKNNYLLVIIDDLEKEFLKSDRLQSKFSWVHQNLYKNNRSNPVKLSNKQKKQFQKDRTTFVSMANDLGYKDLSLIDINAAVYASILNLSLATDDDDLRLFALDMGIETFKTLELLKLMYDENHVKIEQIRAIAGYWIAMSDCPKDFYNDYKSLFNDAPPDT